MNPKLKKLVDQVSQLISEIYASHSGLTESLADGRVESTERKIAALKAKEAAEKEKLKRYEQAFERKAELEKLRSKNEAARSGVLTAIKDAHGKTNGYMRRVGRLTFFYDTHSELVAREENGRTYDAAGVYVLRGDQGLRLLGRFDETH